MSKSKIIPVHSIVRRWLQAEGFDGLYCPVESCGCFLDDLMPCDSPQDQCLPGYKQLCGCGEHQICGPKKQF